MVAHSSKTMRTIRGLRVASGGRANEIQRVSQFLSACWRAAQTHLASQPQHRLGWLRNSLDLGSSSIFKPHQDRSQTRPWYRSLMGAAFGSWTQTARHSRSGRKRPRSTKRTRHTPSAFVRRECVTPDVLARVPLLTQRCPRHSLQTSRRRRTKSSL